MKKSYSVILVLTLCSLCLLINAVLVNAAYPNFEYLIYVRTNDVTFDGKWTSTAEWTDGLQTSISATANAVFRGKWGPYVGPTEVPQFFLVEILNDNTNDANDYWQFCFDGDQSGGTAPGSGDLLLNITGHNTVTFYQGTGSAWAPMATPSSADFQWGNSMSASPTSSTPHWICEIMLNKPNVGLSIYFNARIAVYDASNSAAGVRAWPPTSRDVPNDWGYFNYDMNPIPENLSPSILISLSAVAVLAGSFAFRKKRIGKLANSPPT